MKTVLRTGAIIASLSIGAATLPGGVADATPRPEDLEESVIRRAPVPSPEKPHGEVRLLRRDDGLVVQTVLQTKLLKRAVARIVEKEGRSWPESTPGHDDSMAYVTALREARDRVAAAHALREDPTDRRQRLLIEFVLSSDLARVILAEPRFDDDASMRVIDRVELAVLEPSRDYVRSNMRLIAVDALGVTPEQAEALIP